MQQDVVVKIRSLMVLGVLLMMGSGLLRADDWTLARDSHGIKVWTRLEAGQALRTFKAETVVESRLAALVSLMLDTDQASAWMYRISRVDVLRRDDSQGRFVLRVLTDFPWPLNNRDAVVEGRLWQDEKTGVVTIRSHAVPAGSYPQDPDYVRMPAFEGGWQFRPLAQGRVEVTMTGRADPGGVIPAALVNLIIHETPYQTLRGLQRVIAEKRYQDAQQATIREP